MCAPFFIRKWGRRTIGSSFCRRRKRYKCMVIQILPFVNTPKIKTFFFPFSTKSRRFSPLFWLFLILIVETKTKSRGRPQAAPTMWDVRFPVLGTGAFLAVGATFGRPAGRRSVSRQSPVRRWNVHGGRMISAPTVFIGGCPLRAAAGRPYGVDWEVSPLKNHPVRSRTGWFGKVWLMPASS